MKLLLSAVGALLALSIGAANAADLGGNSYKDNSAPTLIEAPGDYTAFRGAYLGIQGGWSSYNHDMSVIDGDNVELIGLSSVGASGGLFGVSGGYNFTAGRFLVGPYAEFNWANNSSTLDLGNGGFTAKLSHDDEWSIGGRLGYLASPQTVVYGLAAFTSTDTSISASKEVKGLESNVNFHGYTLGIGAESFVTRDVSLKLEGRWSQFNKATLYSETHEEETVATLTSEPSAISVLVGLTYHPRFGDLGALK